MAEKNICTIEGCGKAAKARGWCKSHWSKWRNHGSPTGEGKFVKGSRLKFLTESAVGHDGSECLIWPFDCRSRRPQVRINGRLHIASRWVCEAAKGLPPSPEHEAAHTCGGGDMGCVSGGHLVWKTHAENMRDMVVHGKSQAGEKSVHSRLTESDIAEIKVSAKSATQRQLANRFGVCQSHISRILSGEVWKHT